MISPGGRALQALALLAIGLLFYLTGPFAHTSAPVEKHEYNAEERLARWVEVITPQGSPRNLDQSFDSGPQYVAYLERTKPHKPINPFPLGRPSDTSAASPQVTFHGMDFVDVKFSFQEDLSIPMPAVNFLKYKDAVPRNYRPDEKQETFATYLCTRNGSLHDPYFAATLNLIYRNLWSPTIASKTRPFTVFVAPFITRKQRDILAGAGAIIKELGLLPWEPNVEGVWARWRDQFSKLHMWGETQFKAIAFMDSDAFPIKNIDEAFEEVKVQRCDESKLTPEETELKEDLCNYIFAGVENIGTDGSVNGGFVVLSPQPAMHKRLLRNYVKVDQFDNHVAEQSFFAWQFSKDGPFPVQHLPRKYNAFFPLAIDEGQVSVVHEKLWAWSDELPEWLRDVWPSGWAEMNAFYESTTFRNERDKDSKILYRRTDLASKQAPDKKVEDKRTVGQHAAAHGAMPKAHKHSMEAHEQPAPPPLPELTAKQREQLERRKGMQAPFYAASP